MSGSPNRLSTRGLSRRRFLKRTFLSLPVIALPWGASLLTLSETFVPEELQAYDHVVEVLSTHFNNPLKKKDAWSKEQEQELRTMSQDESEGTAPQTVKRIILESYCRLPPTGKFGEILQELQYEESQN